MFAVIAIVCFLLAVFGASISVNLIALGLAFMAAQLLVGSWPLANGPWIKA